MNVHVTLHAAQRYCERVNPRLTIAEAIEALDTPVIRRAAEFGAPYVKLGTGQHVVLAGWNIVTVLPAETARWRFQTPKGMENG